MWIGTVAKSRCHDLILCAQWIGMYATGRFHEQFEELCGLDQMMEDDVMT
jgi:hypothetical protein